MPSGSSSVRDKLIDSFPNNRGDYQVVIMTQSQASTVSTPPPPSSSRFPRYCTIPDSEGEEEEDLCADVGAKSAGEPEVETLIEENVGHDKVRADEEESDEDDDEDGGVAVEVVFRCAKEEDRQADGYFQSRQEEQHQAPSPSPAQQPSPLPASRARSPPVADAPVFSTQPPIGMQRALQAIPTPRSSPPPSNSPPARIRTPRPLAAATKAASPARRSRPLSSVPKTAPSPNAPAAMLSSAHRPQTPTPSDSPPRHEAPVVKKTILEVIMSGPIKGNAHTKRPGPQNPNQDVLDGWADPKRNYCRIWQPWECDKCSLINEKPGFWKCEICNNYDEKFYEKFGGDIKISSRYFAKCQEMALANYEKAKKTSRASARSPSPGRDDDDFDARPRSPPMCPGTAAEHNDDEDLYSVPSSKAASSPAQKAVLHPAPNSVSNPAPKSAPSPALAVPPIATNAFYSGSPPPSSNPPSRQRLAHQSSPPSSQPHLLASPRSQQRPPRSSNPEHAQAVAELMASDHLMSAAAEPVELTQEPTALQDDETDYSDPDLDEDDYKKVLNEHSGGASGSEDVYKSDRGSGRASGSVDAYMSDGGAGGGGGGDYEDEGNKFGDSRNAYEDQTQGEGGLTQISEGRGEALLAQSEYGKDGEGNWKDPGYDEWLVPGSQDAREEEEEEEENEQEYGILFAERYRLDADVMDDEVAFEDEVRAEEEEEDEVVRWDMPREGFQDKPEELLALVHEDVADKPEELPVQVQEDVEEVQDKVNEDVLARIEPAPSATPVRHRDAPISSPPMTDTRLSSSPIHHVADVPNLFAPAPSTPKRQHIRRSPQRVIPSTPISSSAYQRPSSAAPAPQTAFPDHVPDTPVSQYSSTSQSHKRARSITEIPSPTSKRAAAAAALCGHQFEDDGGDKMVLDAAADAEEPALQDCEPLNRRGLAFKRLSRIPESTAEVEGAQAEDEAVAKKRRSTEKAARRAARAVSGESQEERSMLPATAVEFQDAQQSEKEPQPVQEIEVTQLETPEEKKQRRAARAAEKLRRKEDKELRKLVSQSQPLRDDIQEYHYAPAMPLASTAPLQQLEIRDSASSSTASRLESSHKRPSSVSPPKKEKKRRVVEFPSTPLNSPVESPATVDPLEAIPEDETVNLPPPVEDASEDDVTISLAPAEDTPDTNAFDYDSKLAQRSKRPIFPPPQVLPPPGFSFPPQPVEEAEEAATSATKSSKKARKKKRSKSKKPRKAPKEREEHVGLQDVEMDDPPPHAGLVSRMMRLKSEEKTLANNIEQARKAAKNKAREAGRKAMKEATEKHMRAKKELAKVEEEKRKTEALLRERGVLKEVEALEADREARKKAKKETERRSKQVSTSTVGKKVKEDEHKARRHQKRREVRLAAKQGGASLVLGARLLF